MPSYVCLGLQYGDEGKGRVSDYLAKDMDIGVRFNGGNNAGHTIIVDGHKYVSHLVPATALYPNKTSVISAGVAIDVEILKDEMELFGVGSLNNYLLVDHRCPIITADHKNRDKATTLSDKIGTTNRGIGPCFSDQTSRSGKRYSDVFPTNKKFDATEYIYKSLVHGKKVLFEGAQSTYLDLIHGNYPYVTSCNTTVGAVCTNVGIPPKMINEVYGVFKAYSTRASKGPFITEELGPKAEFIREMGKEYGATTGRTRRIGWLDLVDLRKACNINGVDWLVMTKADILDQMSSFPVCVAHTPSGEPVYKEVAGWMTDISKIKSYKDLPDQFKAFVALIENKTHCPVTLVSTGPDRNQMLRR